MGYLITGGCGFLGSNIAASLIEQGADVTVFDNLSRRGSVANLAWLRSLGRFEFIHGDTRHAEDLAAAVGGANVHAIFHLAGQVAMTTSLQNPRRDFDVNVGGSINLLEALRTSNPRAVVVYASSNKVYGGLANLPLRETVTRYTPVAEQPGVDEQAPLDFHTPYGCSKGAADQYMLDYARTFGLRTIVLRHSTIYGGRQHATIDQGWVGWFCRQALEVARDPDREPFTICGDGKQVRDLLHVSDAVRCYLAAADRAELGSGEAFNIGGGRENSLSLLELFEILERRLEIRLRFRQLPWRASDQRYFVADCRKAGRLLNWQPRISSLAGIAQTLEWERSQFEN
ncbi:MAG: NAD-dependent epimerase/dehydratase family protein [Pirellulaceae bacterium]|nr:NAD-dependent epimerase/dehydratase family protein [Pirellulaceae bacterium]